MFAGSAMCLVGIVKLFGICHVSHHVCMSVILEREQKIQSRLFCFLCLSLFLFFFSFKGLFLHFGVGKMVGECSQHLSLLRRANRGKGG